MSVQSARSALAWAGGAQLFQDIAQFFAMLVLVRFLSPYEYGAMALAQSVLTMLTLFGPGTFVAHALQSRDPAAIDWQSHYTASTVMSVLIAAILLGLAGLAAPIIWGGDVAIALAVLTAAVLLGSPAHVRNTYLHAHHNWARYRLLSITGTCLGLSAGIALGIAGYGIFALAVQPALYVLPAAIDQTLCGFKPIWRFDRAYYRDVIEFGLNRFAAGSLSAVRNFSEQSLMEAHFSIAANGFYGRSVGLSNLLAGRFGSIALNALYPILTRADAGSAHFRRNAERVLQGVAWIAIPAATFLAIKAEAIVALLYGQGWAQVAQLLPAAAAVAAAGALHLTATRLLLANELRRASLVIEAGSAFISLGLAFWLLPIGLTSYMWALAAVVGMSFVCGALFLIRSQAVNWEGLMIAIAPPLLGASFASICVLVIEPRLDALWLPIRLLTDSILFALAYFATIIALFRRSLLDVLTIIPGSRN